MQAYACSPFLLGILLGTLWPLFKRRRGGGLWAVQALVLGDSLGNLSLVAGLFRYWIRGSLRDWRPEIK
jgi:hypothetical protein